MLCKRHGTPLLKIFLAFHLIHGESPVPPTVAGKALHFLVPCPDSPSRLPRPGSCRPPCCLSSTPSTFSAQGAISSAQNHGPVFPYDVAPNLLCSNVTFAQMSPFQQSAPELPECFHCLAPCMHISHLPFLLYYWFSLSPFHDLMLAFFLFFAVSLLE